MSLYLSSCHLAYFLKTKWSTSMVLVNNNKLMVLKLLSSLSPDIQIDLSHSVHCCVSSA